jgi:hypothetical protein
MSDELSLEELVESWTLVESDWLLIANRAGATRLGFALSLKFFELEARFPFSASEFASDVVEFVATQVKVAPDRLAEYEWEGRSATYHRSHIRESFGFRVCTRTDEFDLIEWLVKTVCPVDNRPEALGSALLGECRTRRLEPPGRTERIVGSARNTFDTRFAERTLQRLDAHHVDALERLVEETIETGLLAELNAEAGQLGLETLLREINKVTENAIEFWPHFA